MIKRSSFFVLLSISFCHFLNDTFQSLLTSSGSVIRTDVEQVRETGRDTMGVRLVNLDDGITVVSLAKVSDE